ncbi:MAG: hypothetical protein ACPGQI_09960, partial [Gammaproteobacteria bacterium]
LTRARDRTIFALSFSACGLLGTRVYIARRVFAVTAFLAVGFVVVAAFSSLTLAPPWYLDSHSER